MRRLFGVTVYNVFVLDSRGEATLPREKNIFWRYNIKVTFLRT